jgi:hypothetical protein
VEEFSIDGKLSGTLEDIKKTLEKLPLYLVNSTATELDIAKVESRSISRKPYLFHIIKIQPERLTVIYSLIPDTSVNLRRAEVLKETSAVLSLIAGRFDINQIKFVQYVDSVLESLISGLSQTYTALYNRYDSMLNDYRELKRLNVELSASNRNLTLQSAQLSDENKTMKEQLDALRKYSDESLMALIEEWITVHNNSIDVVAFANGHSLSPTRVEQILDRMVSMGYIEPKG